MRFQDQFGYNEPIVQEFKNRYGVDILTEPLNKTDWINLRGEYTTQFLTELKSELTAHSIKLGIGINPNLPNRSQPWPYTGTIFRTAGEINMDYVSWIDNEITDVLTVFGNSAQTLTTTAQLAGIAQGTGTEVSLMTSNPYAFTGYSYPVVGTLGDEIGYLLYSNIPSQPLSALSDPDPYKRMRILAQIVDGQTSATAADVLPLTSDSNLLVRRFALRSLGVIGDSSAVPTLEAAILDPESAIRNGAIVALQNIRGPNTATQILNSIDQYGNFMFNDAAASALAACTPYATTRAQLADALQNHANPMVREVAGNTLSIYMPNSDVVSALIYALENDPSDNVRQYGAIGLGNINNSAAGVQALIAATALDNVAVSQRAAQVLGKKVGLDPAAQAVRRQIVVALGALYTKLGENDCSRSDCDWGYRPVGDALLAMGQEGEDQLRTFYNQWEKPRLAEMAWLSLYMPQITNDFTVMTEEEYDAVFEKRPHILGDYNNNGAVDSADYTVYRDTLGSTTDLRADGNGNGIVDQADYDLWRANFGTGEALAAGVTVPEPSGIVLALLAAGGLRWRRR